MQTADQEGLTQQAERVRAKKNASRNVRNLIIGLVVVVVGAFLLFKMMSGGQAPKSTMKPIEPLPALPTQPVVPVEPIKLVTPDAAPQAQMQMPATVVAGAIPSPTPVLPASSPATSAPMAIVPAVSVGASTDTSKFVKTEDHETLMGRVKVLEERTSNWTTEVEGLNLLRDRVKKLESGKLGWSGTAKKSVVEGSAKVAPAAPSKAVHQAPQDVRPGFWIEGAGNGAKSNTSIDGATREKAKFSVASGSSTIIATEVIEVSSGKKDKSGDTLVVGNRRAEVVPYQLIAIVQDRAWVKLSDGSMKTVQKGEKLPNGDTVLLIDANKDEVKTSGGLLR
jgi:hypothetical protein